MTDLPILSFADVDSWQQWLVQNHDTHAGLWVRFSKKGSVVASINHAEALECALCYGWIDGQARSESESAWLQKFVPRRANSIWSKINREKAVALIKAGKMAPAGLAAIEAAKKNGRWKAAYDSPANSQVPADLKAALKANAAARAEFKKLDSRNRYAILHRLQTAKKPETRSRRLEQYVTMLERGERLH